jgi:hypothetical protein
MFEKVLEERRAIGRLTALFLLPKPQAFLLKACFSVLCVLNSYWTGGKPSEVLVAKVREAFKMLDLHT